MCNNSILNYLLSLLSTNREHPCFIFPLNTFFSLHSDNEEDRDRSSYNGRSKKEFKDEEETVTTKSVQIVQATETTATRKKGVPSKKVDLGAAANYTGDRTPETTVKQVTHAHLIKKTS